MAACAELSAFYRLIEPLPGCGGSRHYLVTTEKIVASWAAAALHVSRAKQASLGPRRFACVWELQRAHRGPGGYCRPSGNQGTMGRPATALDTLQRILLRTRRSAWRASRGIFPSRGPPLAGKLLSPGARPRHPREASSTSIPRRGAWPSRGFFKWKQALHPLQSAHGLCARYRVTRAPARDDDDAAASSLVIKGGQQSWGK